MTKTAPTPQHWQSARDLLEDRTTAKIAQLLAERDRLAARVDELLAHNTAEVGRRRTVEAELREARETIRRLHEVGL
jgi:hypothetical protein